jgi:hypothetical protein
MPAPFWYGVTATTSCRKCGQVSTKNSLYFTTHNASPLAKAFIGRNLVNQGAFPCPFCPNGEGEVSITFQDGTEKELRDAGFQ